MFLLRNKEGNAFKRVKSEHQRNRWLAKGYVDVTTDPEKKGRTGRNAQATKKADKE